MCLILHIQFSLANIVELNSGRKMIKKNFNVVF